MPLRAAPPVVTGDMRSPASPPATPLVPGARNTDNYKTQPKALKEPYSEQALRDIQKAAAVMPPPQPVPEAAPPVIARVEPPKAPSPADAKPVPAPSPDVGGDDDKVAWMWPATGKLVTGGSENPNLKGIDIA